MPALTVRSQCLNGRSADSLQLTWQQHGRIFSRNSIDTHDVKSAVETARAYRAANTPTTLPTSSSDDAAHLVDVLRLGLKPLLFAIGKPVVAGLFERLTSDENRMFDKGQVLHPSLVDDLVQMEYPRQRFARIWDQLRDEIDASAIPALATARSKNAWFASVEEEANNYMTVIRSLYNDRPFATRMRDRTDEFVADQMLAGIEVVQFAAEAIARLLGVAQIPATVSDFSSILRHSPLVNDFAYVSGGLALAYQKLLSGCDIRCYQGYAAEFADKLDDSEVEMRIRSESPHRHRIVNYDDDVKRFIEFHGRHWFDLRMVGLFFDNNDYSISELSFRPAKHIWKMNDPERGIPIWKTVPLKARGCPMTIGPYVDELRDVMVRACAQLEVAGYALDYGYRNEPNWSVDRRAAKHVRFSGSVRVPAAFRNKGADGSRKVKYG